ncbi:Cytochrome c-type biogenesis protein CcmH [Nymphon striatum]|nr:Cytochrome c-type biogenesis protein CcmH [Nymphon striatum]
MPHAYAVNPDEILPDAALEERARNISANLRCLVCQNQSIDDSDAQLARDLRILVRERISAGDSNAEARFDKPDGNIRGYALFAHCFTCTKDILAARRIATNLSRLGVAVLRFDFTGLGSSQGEFANTSFASNVEDIIKAVEYMRNQDESPSILIGHSLGGAAVLAAAAELPDIEGVVTLGAPSDAEHVLKMFDDKIDEIEANGVAEVKLAGRKIKIGKSFIEAARDSQLVERIGKIRASLLVMHSPVDQTVSIDNATKIFMAAKHPKSFVSLNQADHLLTSEDDAEFAAEMISAWASRLLPKDRPQGEDAIEHVRITETRDGKFQNTVQAGKHRMFADEPTSFGGDDTGPSPYDFLSAALGACTSMTLRMYADFKKLNLGTVTVDVTHKKIHFKDCQECTLEEQELSGKVDQFERSISIDGDVAPEIAQKIEEIANKCPVHRTLEQGAKIKTLVHS